MSDKNPDNPRSRDDARLHKLVSDARGWMQAEGIEDQPLNWDAIAREEQALWWRERLRQAISDLASRSLEFTDSVATHIRQLASATESQAAAALEVTMELAQDTAEHIGRVLVEPAKKCLRSDAAMQWSYASSATRTKSGVAAQEQSAGMFITSAIPGARVIADADKHTLTIEFLDAPNTLLVMLIPENEAEATRVAEVVKTEDTAQAVFENLPAGQFLLSIYVETEG